MNITHRQLVENTASTEKSVLWLQDLGVIPREIYCSYCIDHKMTLITYKKTFRWKCNKCYGAISIFENTIFFNSKLSLPVLLDIVYFWCRDLTQAKLKVEIETNTSMTVFRWYQKLQKLAYVIMKEESSLQIGGPGHVVEIDESKFSKRKYQVGRIISSPWVVGGIDIETKQCFFVEVLNRNSDTLRTIILEKIVPGTLIVSDEWRGYWGLEELGYIHCTVNHSQNFICPLTGANTQLIENTWGWMKRKIRNRGLNKNGDLTLIFAEFLFKKNIKKTLLLLC